MLKVYVINTRKIANKSAYSRAFSCLNSERQKKAEAIKKESTRLQSVAAGYLLYYALKELGIDLKDLSFIKGAKDKPYIKEHPEIFFNLSHSNDYAVLAISDKEVGIDIEKLRPVRSPLVVKALGQEAADQLLSLPDTEQIMEFFRQWTMKESYGKYTGEGLISVLFENVGSSESGLNFYTSTAIEGYYLTICTPLQTEPEYEYITEI